VGSTPCAWKYLLREGEGTFGEQGPQSICNANATAGNGRCIPMSGWLCLWDEDTHRADNPEQMAASRRDISKTACPATTTLQTSARSRPIALLS
jgi:hypothetical protein